MYRRTFTIISLAALSSIVACVNLPTDGEPSFSLTRATDTQKFVVTLKPLTEPVAINQIHSWRIKLTTASGVPVTKAVFYVGGGMPDHGHGFPTYPRVTEQLGDGTYLLEGMKFSMHGRWEIKFAIQAADVSDMVTFNTMIALPATGK